MTKHLLGLKGFGTWGIYYVGKEKTIRVYKDACLASFGLGRCFTSQFLGDDALVSDLLTKSSG